MTEANEKKITSRDEIEKLKRSEVVELPPFLDGTPLVVRLRRPSLQRMAELGQIPNELSTALDDLMDISATESKSLIQDRAKVLSIVAEACMVEPTYEELRDVLDSTQLMAMWSWLMAGVRALEPFRAFREVFISRQDVRGLEGEALADSGDRGPADGVQPGRDGVPVPVDAGIGAGAEVREGRET
jgi:hypothetical protein